MQTVQIHTAKAQLSALLERAERGEEIVIARRNRPIAKLVAIHALPALRRFGAARGMVALSDAFFDPLSAEEQALWEDQEP